ncbi:MAG TPA: flagellar assembly protein FliW [Armatimonadota bacterium]|nr:flagellar assembly protein FliW [Armatimonadota bacterium]HPP73511.1 flagellar assembly protein FliW [Armatimonadota bacterium]
MEEKIRGSSDSSQTSYSNLLEYVPGTILLLPRGLIGLEGVTQFKLISPIDGSTLKRLQSVDHPDIAFAVLDLSELFPGCAYKLSKVEMEYLELKSPDDAAALIILGAGKHNADIAVDLACPIIVNPKTRVGLQIVLDDECLGGSEAWNNPPTALAVQCPARAA